MNISKVILELYQTLTDAWQEADLPGRLREWWWVITHPALVDAPHPARACEALLQEIQEDIEDLVFRGNRRQRSIGAQRLVWGWLLALSRCLMLLSEAIDEPAIATRAEGRSPETVTPGRLYKDML
jgi:hypothetical protein